MKKHDAMTEHDEDEQVKEVYARFGLAIYNAQVLEHGLVNALVILDLVPSRRHLARSPEEWEAAVDGFMDRHFEETMGQLMRALRDVIAVPADLEDLLREALKRRNWLAHDFFRERAAEFMNPTGMHQMLREVDECRACFEATDNRLEEIVRPIRSKAGITDELLESEYQRMVSDQNRDG